MQAEQSVAIPVMLQHELWTEAGQKHGQIMALADMCVRHAHKCWQAIRRFIKLGPTSCECFVRKVEPMQLVM